MKNVRNEVLKFERTFNAKIKTHWMRMPIVSPVDKWYDNNPVFEDKFFVKDVPAVEITMPEECFETILEKVNETSPENREWQEYNYINKKLGPGWVYRLVELDEQQRRESRLQQTNPALKKAWDQYQLMLKLCENQ